MSASAARGVAEPVAGDRVEEQRLDDGDLAQRRARRRPGPGARTSIAARASPRPGGARRPRRAPRPSSRSSSGSPASVARAAAVSPSRSCVSTRHCRTWTVSACRVTSIAWHRSAARNAASACSSRPWPTCSMPRARCTSSAVAGSRSGRQGLFGPIEPALAPPSKRPCQTSTAPIIASATQTIGSVAQPVRLGDRDRLQRIAPRPGERALAVGQGQVGQTADLDVRPADPPRQREALLQVPLGLVDAATTTARRCRGSSARAPGRRCRARPRPACPPPRRREQRLHLARATEPKSPLPAGRARAARPRA